MDFNKTEKNFVDAMAAQEGKLSELYHSYSLVFPDSDFWKDLSIDESIHKDWVLSLYNSQEKIFIDQQHFRLEAMKSMMAYIDKLGQEIKYHSLIETLTLVLDVEKSLIEKDCFKVFETDSAEVKRILAQLLAATEGHIKGVEIELNRVRTF